MATQESPTTNVISPEVTAASSARTKSRASSDTGQRVRRATAYSTAGVLVRRSPVGLEDAGKGTDETRFSVPVKRSSSGRHSPSGPRSGSADDELEMFNSAILAIRWATTVACIAMSWSAFVLSDLTVVPWVAAVVGNTAIRTLTPLKYDRSLRSTINLFIEVGLHLLAVAATGHWNSPLAFSLLTAIIVAAFARGFGFGIRVSLASAIGVSLSSLSSSPWSHADRELAVQWAIILFLVAIVAGYARRISFEASKEHSLALDRLTQLTDANTLLANLHRVTQTLPASLDLDEVLDSTIGRLRKLLEFDSALVVLCEETDDIFRVLKRSAIRTPSHFREADLPLGASRAIDSGSVVTETAKHGTTPAFHPDSQAALFAPLFARGSTVGFLVIERRKAEPFSDRDIEMLRAFVEPTALAIDNARWFTRIRTVGADEERNRIARDLHDRIGQSLAHLAFELDRVVLREAQQQPIADDLGALRSDLRQVVSEVRDTLYDLRSDVAEHKDFAATLAEFSERVASRSGLEVVLDCAGQARLPILQEREMWRIAQEALINVERHADADTVKITWRCDGANADLTIDDDGCGFSSADGRVDSYGLLGMRERAVSIDALLEVISSRGEGTSVQCRLTEK